MSRQDIIRKYLELIVDSLTLALFFTLFFIGGYALLDAKIVDDGTGVDAEISSLSPQSDDGNLDFSELKKINPEIIGWLRIDNTNLDYPVTQTDNNSKYLVRNYRNEYSTAGAVFVDSRNAQFSDDFTIIYGHRVDGSRMFGEVSKYAEKAFFDDHLTGTLYTEDGTYKLDVIAYSVLNIGTTTVYRLDANKNFHNQEILQEILASSKQQNTATISSDKLLMLSTCDKDSQKYRDVLLLSVSEQQ